MPPPDNLEGQLQALARDIQTEVDADILRALETSFGRPSPLDRTHLAEIREELDRWPLRTGQLIMNQEDYLDILAWGNTSNPETLQGNGGAVTITGGTGGSTSGTGGAVTITGGNARGVDGVGGPVHLSGRRVTIPEFEIFSSPTFNMRDIRTRRFDLLGRSPPACGRILEAVIKAKTPQTPPARMVWVSPRTQDKTVWELLVESE